MKTEPSKKEEDTVTAFAPTGAIRYARNEVPGAGDSRRETSPERQPIEWRIYVTEDRKPKKEKSSKGGAESARPESQSDMSEL